MLDRQVRSVAVRWPQADPEQSPPTGPVAQHQNGTVSTPERAHQLTAETGLTALPADRARHLDLG
ncbi:MAG: hypothetical protein IH884_11510 [Myxococcales bacterium]|nr:hypothetical protein [Myxococcales bacterium]